MTEPPIMHAHFIGIGGAGMSALARVLAQRGVKVSGSDIKESRYSKSLARMDVPIHIGHDAAAIEGADVVVYSTAISDDNPEIFAARSAGIETWHRARMLGYLAGTQKTIAVAGTHGKTSTSSMVTIMLRGMGLDPTFCVGGEIDGIDSNAEHGSGDCYVVEADESDGSFLHLDPYIAVVTNIEADHLDHYVDLAHIRATFSAFMERISDDGCLIVCGDDADLVALARESGKRVLTYGTCAECDLRFTLEGREGIGTRFAFTADGAGKGWAAHELAPYSGTAVASTPGTHMASNSCAALAVAWFLGLDLTEAARSLSAFTGVRRRFDLVGEVDGVTVVDDYAHHPTEVAATLEAASQLDFGRVIALFQPHRYTRTQAFEREFGRSFDPVWKSVILDVYSAGETPIPGVSGRSVTDAILDHDERAQVAYLPHRKDVVPYLVSQVRPGDLVMTIGAGDVTAIGPELVASLRGKEPRA